MSTLNQLVQREPTTESHNHAETPSRTILVIEDNLDIRQALNDLLTSEGYVVECASDGASALKLLRSGLRPRAILLDMMMQGMNGEQFHQEQRTDPQLADIPVVALSGNRRALDEAVAAGAVAGITKPFRFESLKKILEGCI